MRSTNTAVLERNATIGDGFCTEPYELPWAAEARFFVHVLEITEGIEVTLNTQISPDGLHWCDLEEDAHRVTEAGLTSWSVTRFGQWLRLSCAVVGAGGGRDSQIAKVRIYLVGKS